MDIERANVLVVAGYDQSAGAGVLSDVKTLEAHGVYGYAVCTGFTFQNEREISRVQWFAMKEIFEQIDLCFASKRFDWVKMGITPSMRAVVEIIEHLRQHNKGVKVVLDPVIRASNGHDFWIPERSVPECSEGNERGKARDEAFRSSPPKLWDDWEAVAGMCYLLTPNWEEMGWLYPGEDLMERCRVFTREAGNSIYLKGGHHPELQGRDYLWSRGELQVFDAIMDRGFVYPKHGSGCVLSSSLSANLALGYSLPEAAAYSKRYIGQFLTSNKTLLGWHQAR